jgi:hypothetical protein
MALAFIPKTDPAQDTVDHIDGDVSNWKLSNLRWLTEQQNHLNHKIVFNQTGWPGVTKTSKGLFQATIKVFKKKRYLGTFKSEIHASLVYMLEAERVHGACMRKELRDLLDANRHLIPDIERINKNPTRDASLPPGGTVNHWYDKFQVRVLFKDKQHSGGIHCTREEGISACQRLYAVLSGDKRQRLM